MRKDYTYTSGANPHAVRSREMLKKYPEIKKLMKPYPISSLWITIITCIQLLTGYFIVDYNLGLGWTLLLAYTVGAICAHSLFVMVHEATHDAIFKKKVNNRIWGILCNVGQGLPSAMGFRTYHLLHHSHLGEYDHDADLAFNWEAKAVKNIWWRKALWFLFFLIIEVVRPARLKKGKTFDRWVFLNIAFILVTNLLIYKFIGPMALTYIVLSSVFSLGLHPLGARWIQEHYIYREGQETYSYYGPLNRIQFDIGFHNEHHDFYRIPWVNLRKLKAIAPEYYDGLYSHQSWTKLLLDFIFNPERDLYQRIVRERNQDHRNQEKSLLKNNCTPPLNTSATGEA